MASDETRPAVETRQLVKKYGAFTAVDHLDLKIARGETYGLLGPNGSGKTTIVKMLCGLLKPTGGEAFVLDSNAGDRSVASRTGYMPQGDRALPGLDGARQHEAVRRDLRDEQDRHRARGGRPAQVH